MVSAPITAIVIAHNSAQVLPACFDSLRNAGLPTLLVDNASADQSTALARDAGAQIIVNDKNQGFGRAINLGLARSDSEFCLIINPDIAFDPDAPSRLLDLLRAAPDAAMAAPKLLEPDGRVFELRDSPINSATAAEAPVGAVARPLLSGAALLVRRDKLLAIGGFDPNIFLFWEDNDLCRRLVDAGDTLLLAESVVMRHKRGGSSAPAPGAVYLRRWHQAWSRFYVFKKFGVASKPDQWIVRFSRKAMLAELARSPVRIERYRGSRDGAIAFHEGKTALKQQDLV